MYNNPIAPTVMAGAGTLAMTGGTAGMHPVWIALGTFALLAAAAALLRAAPKPQA